MALPATRLRTAAPPRSSCPDPPDFTTIYRGWYAQVSDWMRALGIPPSDCDDVAQEVFLVVRRRLPDFDGNHLAAWLRRIAVNVTGDHRRRAWYLNLVSRRGTADLRARPDGSDPEQELQRKRLHDGLARLLCRMSHKHRSALLLFAVEGYSGDEIAALERVPVDTVWTRLHHARKHMRRLLTEAPDREPDRATDRAGGSAGTMRARRRQLPAAVE